MPDKNMLEMKLNNETIYGVLSVNRSLWVLTSKRVIEITGDLNFLTLHRFSGELSSPRWSTSGNSLYFTANGSLLEYKKESGLRKLRELQVNPIDICVQPARNLFAYLFANQLTIEIGGVKNLIPLSELYRGVRCFERQEQILLLLIGLWGYTTFNLEGKLEFYKTFGDLVNSVEILSKGDYNRIFVGSKNGSFYIGDDHGNIIGNVSLGKSLSKFDVVIVGSGFYVVWACFDGSVNLLELDESGVVKRMEKLASLNLDVENISVTVTDNRELLIAASEKRRLVLLKEKILK